MTETAPASALTTAHRLLVQAVDAVRAAAGPTASDEDLVSVLLLCEGVTRQVDRVSVDAVAGLERPVTIRRDGWGVPHVEAETDADAMFGLGFAQGLLEQSLGHVGGSVHLTRVSSDAAEGQRWFETACVSPVLPSLTTGCPASSA